MIKTLTPAQLTVRAATITRRSFLRAGAAAGAVGLAGPLYVKDAFSSSGEVNFAGWAGYPKLAEVVFPAFEKATGIKVNFTEIPD
jgi:spermidine/putrescine transport system substrate-binding protein